MTYIHELPGWPRFTWSTSTIGRPLAQARHRQGRLLGRMEALGFASQGEAVLRALTEETLKSSEIEGELLNPAQVRSSLARRLGIEAAALPTVDRHVEGVVEMVLDATQGYAAPLSADRLFGWHAALFPTGRSGMRRLVAGAWRRLEADPMQVVSGPTGHERVHFEAPAAARVPEEMDRFLTWFNADEPMDLVLKAALAHLWFVTIHPFEDGNGRMARALTDMMLARAEGSPQRFYSMSAQIRVERGAYYDVLETTQRGGLDVTPWLLWFFGCLERACDGAEATLATVLNKARFWEAYAGAAFNTRQHAMLNRLLDGFEGKLTSSKWAALAKCSQDTAGRDIDDLVKRGVLEKSVAGGRSTSYTLRGVSGASSSASATPASAKNAGS